MTEDVRAIRAKFLEKRQAQIDARKEENPQERTSFVSGLNQPPARRATDGKEPNTTEEHPLEMAKKLENDDHAADGDIAEDNNSVPTKASNIPTIKAYLDAQGISYDGVTKKDDLLALIPEQE